MWLIELQKRTFFVWTPLFLLAFICAQDLLSRLLIQHGGTFQVKRGYVHTRGSTWKHQRFNYNLSFWFCLSNTTGAYQWSRLPEIYSSGLEPWCWSLHSRCHVVVVCYPLLYWHRYLRHDTTLNLSVCPLKEWLVKSIKYQDCQSLLLSQHPADFPD